MPGRGGRRDPGPCSCGLSNPAGEGLAGLARPYRSRACVCTDIGLRGSVRGCPGSTCPSCSPPCPPQEPSPRGQHRLLPLWLKHFVVTHFVVTGSPAQPCPSLRPGCAAQLCFSARLGYRALLRITVLGPNRPPHCSGDKRTLQIRYSGTRGRESRRPWLRERGASRQVPRAPGTRIRRVGPQEHRPSSPQKPQAEGMSQ